MTVSDALKTFAEAIREYESLLTLNPRYAQGYSNLGTAYLLMKDLGRATQAFQKAVRLAPDHAESHYNLGLLYLQQGLKAEGEAELETYKRLLAAKQPATP